MKFLPLSELYERANRFTCVLSMSSMFVLFYIERNSQNKSIPNVRTICINEMAKNNRESKLVFTNVKPPNFGASSSDIYRLNGYNVEQVNSRRGFCLS